MEIINDKKYKNDKSTKSKNYMTIKKRQLDEEDTNWNEMKTTNQQPLLVDEWRWRWQLFLQASVTWRGSFWGWCGLRHGHYVVGCCCPSFLAKLDLGWLLKEKKKKKKSLLWSCSRILWQNWSWLTSMISFELLQTKKLKTDKDRTIKWRRTTNTLVLVAFAQQSFLTDYIVDLLRHTFIQHGPWDF